MCVGKRFGGHSTAYVLSVSLLLAGGFLLTLVIAYAERLTGPVIEHITRSVRIGVLHTERVSSTSSLSTTLVAS
jgi:hypothetical protein